MFKLPQTKISQGILYLAAFMASSSTFAYITRRPEYYANLRAEKEYRSYDWTCDVTSNDYDYIMTVDALKTALSEQTYTLVSSYLLAFGLAMILLVIIASLMSRLGKPLHSGGYMILIPALCLIPIATYYKLESVVDRQSTEIKELRYQLAALDPVDGVILDKCKPSKKNVRFLIKADSVENQKSGDLFAENTSDDSVAMNDATPEQENTPANSNPDNEPEIPIDPASQQ